MAQTSRARSWFSSLVSIDRLFGFKGQVAKNTRKPAAKLNLEMLEDRYVLSVAFTPAPLTTPANLVDVAHPALNLGCTPIEPQITVNPTDPGNLAISQQDALQVSNDATGTYTPPGATLYPVTSNGRCGDTSTAFDGQGRLFWANLSDFPTAGVLSVFVTQINPTTGAQIGTTHPVSLTPAGDSDDKEFLVANPRTNDLYIAWTRFSPGGNTTVELSRSTDQGVTWSAPVAVSGAPTTNFVWPATVSIGTDNTVYVAYHETPGAASDANGEVVVARYSSDLATQMSSTLAFTSGNAAIRGVFSANYPGVVFSTQGSGESWVLADPSRAGNVYVVALNDPNAGGAGDAGNVVFSKSTNFGSTWATSTIDTHPANAGGYDLFPAASIDQFGDIVVTWYENDAGTNGAGHSKLDVYASYSTDGGATFSSSFKISDTPLDPGSDARIDDYIGNSIFGGTAYAVWEGDGGPGGRQTFSDAIAIKGALTINGDDGGPQNDSITVRAVAGNSSFLEVLVNGKRQYAGLAAALTSINVNGLLGSNTLTVDESNGVITVPINYDGGTGVGANNVLNLQGGAFTNEVDTATGAHSGTIALDSSSITYKNLAPIIDTATALNFAVNGTGAAGEAFNIVNDPNGTENGGIVTDEVNGNDFEKYDFGNKTNVSVNAGATLATAGPSVFTVDVTTGAASLSTVALFGGGGGHNTFFITAALPGGAALSIDGGTSGLNVLFGPNVNETWNLAGANQGNIGGALTLFKNVQYLIGGTGDDVFVFSTGASEGTVNGGYGNNTIVGAPNEINAFDITGSNAGDIVGALASFANMQNLAGSALPGNTGTDVFEFYPFGGLAGHIAGGTGSEWLYYQPLSTPIWVNLSIGVVSRVQNGVTHLPTSPLNVIGSAVGGDIIIGDASGGVLEAHNGGNTIEAGSGRTIIIGGYGRNYLVGGAADDLIIAGTTIYDYDILTLTSFLTEWQSIKVFGTRVNDLRTGAGQPGGHALILNQTVFCTGTAPGPRFGRGGGNGQTTMFGNGGQNWFFTLYPTTIVDLKPTDQVD